MARGGGGRERKRRRDSYPQYGLYSRTHAKPVRWQVDWDYLDKLNPEEKAWLARFADEYYDGSFKNDGGELHTKEQRRECYRKKNSANVDVYSIYDEGGALVRGDVPEREVEQVRNWQTPEYLDDEDYKNARDGFRRHTPTDGRARFKDTPAARRAKKKLQKVVPK